MKPTKLWHSELINVLTDKIKDMDKSLGPTFLRSEKLLWELEREKVSAELDAWKEGKPSVEGSIGLVRQCRAMGLRVFDFPQNFDQTIRYGEYKTKLERAGYPEKCCEHAMAMLAMGELGELPRPDMILISGHACDVKIFSRRVIAEILNVPVFTLDIPLNEDDRPDLPAINNIADQMGEFAEWAEKKAPGIKYDEDKHIEMLEMDAIGAKLSREIWQFLRHVPCPIGPLDIDRKRMVRFIPSHYPDMQKAVEFLRVCRDELGERVASGKGSYPEERLRILWAGQVPGKSVLDISKLFQERKIASPLKTGGHIHWVIGLRGGPIGEVAEYGIKLSPFQEEARFWLGGSIWGGPGKRWVNGTLDLARDMKAQGIIHYLTIGCTPMRSLGSVVAERAEKELGIPTLNMEGRLHDRSYRTPEQFEEVLGPFIDKCFDRVGKARQ